MWGYWLRWVGIPLGLYGFWGIVPGTAWPRSFTALAFPIYLMHLFVCSGARLIARQWFPEALSSLSYFLVVSLLAMGLSALTALLFRAFAPRFATFLFGGR